MKYLYLDTLVAPGDITLGQAAQDNPHSAKNAGKSTSPKENALKCLEKARLVADLTRSDDFGSGRQVLLPPPNEYIDKLRAFQRRELERPFSPAGSKFTANHATVIPATDSVDGKSRILMARGKHPHRRNEVVFFQNVYQQVFKNTGVVVEPWATWTYGMKPDERENLADEGRADMMRLVRPDGTSVWIFLHDEEVQGRQSHDIGGRIASKFLDDGVQTGFFQKSQRAQDAGVFHQDVGAFASDGKLVFHQATYQDPEAVLAFASDHNIPVLMVTDNHVALDEVVQNYLFNSQVVYDRMGRVQILANQAIMEDPTFSDSARVLGDIADFMGAVDVLPVDLSESIMAGGGAACLRLDASLKDEEIPRIPGRFFVSSYYEELRELIQRDYPNELNPHLLEKGEYLPALFGEIHKEIARIMGFPGIYDKE